MSLVACLFGDGKVSLIADLLVSRPPLVGEDVAAQVLPTVPSGLAIPGIQETRLRRKLYIINPRLAVGVAGARDAMKRFVVDAKERFGARFATLDEISAFKDAREYPADGDAALQVIIAHADSPRPISDSQHRQDVAVFVEGAVHEEASVPGHGCVYAIGSGARSFVASASQTPRPRESGAGSSYDGFLHTVGLGGSFLADEATTGRRLKEGWGAGFEFLGLFDGQFKRPASVTFTTWLRHDHGLALQSLIKYETLPNERVLAWAMTPDGPKPFGALGLHEEPGGTSESPLPEFTSDFVCHTFFAEHAGKLHQVVYTGTRDSKSVLLSKDGSTYKIEIDPAFLRMINQRLAVLFAARKAERT